MGSDPPDVIVLDLKMPGMDGLSVLKEIKRKHPGLRIIILSAFLDGAKEQQLKSAGAFACLSKPVDIEALAERITSAAANRKGF